MWLISHYQGIRWRHRRIGHTQWGLIQRFDAYYAAFERQPHIMDIRHARRRWWCTSWWWQLTKQQLRSSSTQHLSKILKKLINNENEEDYEMVRWFQLKTCHRHNNNINNYYNKKKEENMKKWTKKTNKINFFAQRNAVTLIILLRKHIFNL